MFSFHLFISVTISDKTNTLTGVYDGVSAALTARVGGSWAVGVKRNKIVLSPHKKYIHQVNGMYFFIYVYFDLLLLHAVIVIVVIRVDE